MNVIPPMAGAWAITPAQLTSSTAAEPGPGEEAWVSTTNYPKDHVVIRATTHRQYMNLIAGQDATLPENAPTRWKDIGATNRWAMFDMMRNTPTVLASPLTWVITPGQRVDSLALIGLKGVTNAQVSVTTNGNTVYNITRNLTKRIVSNWYDYTFAPFTTLPNVVLLDLPPFINAIITITLSGAGTVSCSGCIANFKQFIGTVDRNSAESDLANYSTVDRDADGNATFEPTRSIPVTNLTMYLDKALVKRAYDLRDLLNGAAAVWVTGMDDTDSFFYMLFRRGFYRKFIIDVDDPTRAKITLQLEEI